MLACAVAATSSACGKDERPPYRLRSHPADAGNDTSDTGDTGDTGDTSDTSDAPPELDDAGQGGQAVEPPGDAGAPSVAPGGCTDGPVLRVLFIGNSHTYTNDLPSLVRELSCAAGTQVITQSATPGGVGFVEHAMDPNTLAAIEADAWDLVIMQDQQQRPGLRLEDVESDHVPSLVSLVDAIASHRARTRPLLYMVWARREGDTTNCP